MRKLREIADRYWWVLFILGAIVCLFISWLLGGVVSIIRWG